MKISIKLSSLAAKLGKSITQIADETGLNRNTVTALYHNKVDGIKFDTIEKICDTYGLSLDEVLGVNFALAYAPKPVKEHLNIYKQEGEIVPFTSWPFAIQAAEFRPDLFDQTYEVLWGYFQKNYGWGYWDLDLANKVATRVYAQYHEPRKADKFYQAYLTDAQDLEDLYYQNNPDDIAQLSLNEFKSFYKSLQVAYKKFWAISLFIDSFDPGYDQLQINEIAEKYKLSSDEVAVLSTPAKMTFNNERLFALLSLCKSYKRQKKYKSVKEFVLNSAEVEKYIKDYDYYKSNYAFVKHITGAEITKEMEDYLADLNELDAKYRELKDYERDRNKTVRQILSRHDLGENPLYFFQLLTYWREHRKKVNLMGIHLLYNTLSYLEKKSGIKEEYLKFISMDEVEAVLSGLITQGVLEKRYNGGIFASFDETGYKLVEGEQAQSLKEEFEQKLKHEVEEKIVRGQTAAQGYAQGVARIILSQEDFSKLKDGDILVTSMTRPEYLPIMKKAGAFVTNEGGITCHAAIVARELGKPCVIGTKNATTVIKDGDMVEVRATHGTVRIISK